MFCDVLPRLVVLIMTASQSPQQITQNLKQPQHASDLCFSFTHQIQTSRLFVNRNQITKPDTRPGAASRCNPLMTPVNHNPTAVSKTQLITAHYRPLVMVTGC